MRRALAILTLSLVSVLPARFAWASPPVDLAGGNERKRPKERPLTQDDLVYTDNVKPDEAVLKDSGRVLFDVVGRSLPSRKGKPVHRFSENDLIRILKDSKDGRWVAIETFSLIQNKAHKRAWVPKNSVKATPPPPPPPEPTPSETPPATMEGGDFSAMPAMDPAAAGAMPSPEGGASAAPVEASTQGM